MSTDNDLRDAMIEAVRAMEWHKYPSGANFEPLNTHDNAEEITDTILALLNHWDSRKEVE